MDKKVSMKILVIEIKKGGLGDHLFYSHIPRIAKETNAFDKVFISNYSIFRNEDYKDLIWKTNPYIDGFSGERGIFFSPKNIGTNENILDAIMLGYGLDDSKRMHDPEIYYKPPIELKWKNETIYDPNYISYAGDIKNSTLIKAWLQKNNILINYQMAQLGKKYLPIDCDNYISTKSLIEFCSLIVSCKKMYCLTTGTATLAAALQVPVTVLYGNGQLQLYRHAKQHQYINVGSDYTLKDYIKKILIIIFSKFFKLGTR